MGARERPSASQPRGSTAPVHGVRCDGADRAQDIARVLRCRRLPITLHTKATLAALLQPALRKSRRSRTETRKEESTHSFEGAARCAHPVSAAQASRTEIARPAAIPEGYAASE